MGLTQTTTHIAEAKARFVQQFRAKPNMEAWLADYVTQVQDLEDVFFQLLLDRVIATAIGVQLDGLGAIVGEERKGKSDASYRIWIRGRILANRSSGTPEQMLELADLVTDANTLAIEEYYPAGFNLIIYDDLVENVDDVAAILDAASPAGVRAHMEYRLSAEALMFAFAGGDTIETSAANWTERANPANVDLYAVAHGSGLWTAVGKGAVDTYIVTSPDGFAPWTERANPKNANLYSVVHDGSGLWTAVGESDGVDSYIITSPNGAAWTERTSPQNRDLRGVTHTGSAWVAVGRHDGSDAFIITSADAVTWAEQTNPKAVDLNAVAYGAGLLVAVGDADGVDSYIITSSTNGASWIERAPAVAKNVNLYGVAYGAGLFVAVGEDVDGSSYILTSTDGGVTDPWTRRTPAVAKAIDLYTVSYGGDLWVAAGETDGVDGYILTSQDGLVWIERDNPKLFALHGIASDSSGLWVAAGVADGADAYLVTSFAYPTANQGFSDDGGNTGGKWAGVEDI